MNHAMTHKDLGEMFELSQESQDQSDTVNILLYKGTVYGVFARYEDAEREAVRRFGEAARLCLTATILRQKVQ